MRFDCDRRKPLEWHKWFAWYPIEISLNECVWLEVVERRFSWRGSSGTYYDPKYREVTK